MTGLLKPDITLDVNVHPVQTISTESIYSLETRVPEN